MAYVLLKPRAGVIRIPCTARAAGDREHVSEILDRDRDIAAIIIEPTGAHFGSTPLQPDFLRFLRDVATAHHCLLIFDEVVTGFRVAPGGMQQVVNVLPDLTTLGKILTGGVPGGAVAGRADILPRTIAEIE